MTKLNKKKFDHVLLVGDNCSGIFHFLEHYANNRTVNNTVVIVRTFENNTNEPPFKIMRSSSDFIDPSLDDDFQLREWFFMVKSGEIPLYEIQKILAKKPMDRILVGLTETAPVLKGFRKLKYPAIKIVDLQDAIVDNFDVSQKEA
jgi:hypothetical protein